jgi:hypothetical protein
VSDLSDREKMIFRGQLLSLLLLVGFVLHYFWWLAAIGALVVVVKYGNRVWREHRADVDAWETQQKAITKRADHQHAWTVAGDPRGLYGDQASAVRRWATSLPRS